MNIADAPASQAASDMLAKVTDAVIADDVIDGAARWYAYKATVKMQKLMQSGGKR